jgi:hypothetical protein
MFVSLFELHGRVFDVVLDLIENGSLGVAKVIDVECRMMVRVLDSRRVRRRREKSRSHLQSIGAPRASPCRASPGVRRSPLSVAVDLPM